MQTLKTKIFTAIYLFFGFSGLSAQSSDSTKKLPPTQWTRSRSIDVKHIVIDLKFDWQKRQAFGSATITLTPFKATNTIALDGAMLTIHSISTLNGTDLKFDYDGSERNNALSIELDRTYASGEKIVIKINYHTNWINEISPSATGGSDGKGIRFLEPISIEPRRRKQIWSMGEPELNRYWFPGYDSPNDLRTTEFIATVEKNLTVVSNGDLIERKNNGDGTVTFHFKTDTPHPNHKTAFVVGEYVDIKQHFEGVQLHSLSYPDEVTATTATVERLPDMVRFFSEYTGVRYPYSSYSQVFVQESPWGISYNSMAINTENMVDDYATHADFLYLWDGLEAEALAHQWFGNLLTIEDWSEIWLNRSFAHYFDALYNEYKNGHEEFLLFPWAAYGYLSTYLADWNGGLRHPVVTHNYDNALNFVSDSYSYARGSLVLHMLRKHLGEERWKKAVRLYVKTNAGKAVTTQDFIKAIAETTGESMEWFFDQWIYKMGHPIFEVTKKYDVEKKVLTLFVKQTQKVDLKNPYPQVEFFQGNVEIEIDGHIETVWLQPIEENVFVFGLSDEPNVVNFDYEGTWIKELKFDKPLSELVWQIENGKDIYARRWAMGELVKLAKNEKTSTVDKEKIYRSFRTLIASKCYWRLKAMALSLLQSLLVGQNQEPAQLDAETTGLLLSVIKNEKAWVRSAALNFLGATRNQKYADLYLYHLNDVSDRVVNSAAIAFGKSKSSKAFEALARLKSRPSWKNQSLISSLAAMKELGDKRAIDFAAQALADLNAPRWTLVTPIWDFRITAAQTIQALGKSDVAYAMIQGRLEKAIALSDTLAIFSNLNLMATLGDNRSRQVFTELKHKFKNDAEALSTVEQLEEQLVNNIKR